jgi:hypothetical protein
VLAALIAAAGALAACDGDASVSVGVGVGVAAPWGGVTVATPVPVGPYGPYYGGRFGPMW